MYDVLTSEELLKLAIAFGYKGLVRWFNGTLAYGRNSAWTLTFQMNSDNLITGTLRTFLFQKSLRDLIE